jgi:hypothetical protein
MTAEYREQLFDKLTARMKEVLTAKGSDYANEDVLSNFKLAGAICQLSAQRQCLSLIATKVARLGVLLVSNDPKNEPTEDNMLDLINYGVLLYCLRDEEIRELLQAYVIVNMENSVLSLTENELININDKTFIWKNGALEELPF